MPFEYRTTTYEGVNGRGEQFIEVVDEPVLCPACGHERAFLGACAKHIALSGPCNCRDSFHFGVSV
jgi:hypothetical protein